MINFDEQWLCITSVMQQSHTEFLMQSDGDSTTSSAIHRWPTVPIIVVDIEMMKDKLIVAS